ncbi:MAG: monofunctional biosynthetic peptidoglycan transglycosylase [Balneolaceae bacterium]
MEEHTSIPWKKYGKILGGVILGWSFWFCLLVLVLRWVNPPFTAFTLQEEWGELGTERYSLRTNWVPGNEIPDHLKLAVVASEDQRFYEHWGLDLAAIDQAIEENQQGRRIRGASTITQQVAKNLVLSSTQSYLRKGVEAGIAVLIEIFWTKDRILEVYLNIAEFGPGIYGIGEASDFWFEKEVHEITPKESARLATVLPNPKLIKADPASEYVQERSFWILRNMQQLSGIQYIPQPEPDTTDTLLQLDVISDSVSTVRLLDLDSLQLHLDSMLMEMELEH